MSDDEDLAALRGIAQRTLSLVKHATFEVGPSPDDLWAFRVTVHPFRSEAEAEIGVEKMKTYLRTMGFKFKGDPE